MPVYTQNLPRKNFSPNPKGPIFPKWVWDYLQTKIPNGNRNNMVFHVAGQFRDARIPIAEALPQITACAVRDGLSVAEAEKSIRSAYSMAPREPLGGNGNGSYSPNGAHRRPPGAFSGSGNGNIAGPKSGASAANVTQLPAPIADGFRVLLENIFLAGEGVALSGIVIEPNGDRRPGPGDVLSRERWLERINQAPIGQIYFDSDGAYIRINPMCPGGRRDLDVTDLRHVLVEFDEDENGNRIPKLTQYQALVSSGFPIAAIIDSGNKSLHGLVRVDARTDRGLFDARRDIVFKYFAAWNVDPKNSNPSRYSRCPEIARALYDDVGNVTGTVSQELLAIGLGPTSWAEWEKAQEDEVRKQFRALIRLRDPDELPHIAPLQLVEGLLYQGAKLSFSGGSKMFKSWNFLHFCFCVANGLPFLGFPTARVPVAIFDLELFEFDLWFRLKTIADVYKLLGNPFANLRVVPLRGRYVNFGDPVFQEVFIEVLSEFAVGLFGIDPLYKALANIERYDENSNSDVTRVLRPFEEFTLSARASFVYCQHFSKGNQSAKDPIDRIAGGGAFGRDPDVLSTFTAHREPDAFTINVSQRSFAFIDPFVVRWQFPVFVRDDSLDPDNLAPGRFGRQKDSCRQELIMAALRGAEDSGGLSAPRLCAATGIPKRSFFRYVKGLIDKGEVMKSVATGTYQLGLKNAQTWHQTI
jgi:RecA-family ATPase